MNLGKHRESTPHWDKPSNMFHRALLNETNCQCLNRQTVNNIQYDEVSSFICIARLAVLRKYDVIKNADAGLKSQAILDIKTTLFKTLQKFHEKF